MENEEALMAIPIDVPLRTESIKDIILRTADEVLVNKMRNYSIIAHTEYMPERDQFVFIIKVYTGNDVYYTRTYISSSEYHHTPPELLFRGEKFNDFFIDLLNKETIR